MLGFAQACSQASANHIVAQQLGCEALALRTVEVSCVAETCVLMSPDLVDLGDIADDALEEPPRLATDDLADLSEVPDPSRAGAGRQRRQRPQQRRSQKPKASLDPDAELDYLDVDVG
eukprot:8269452-Alexandrium_andersonii.AAC.1